MRIKTIITTAAITASMAFAAGASADGLTPTKVTIKGTNGDYYGHVKSADADNCANGRTVKVFKMLGASPNPKADLKIGTDSAEANGGKYMWAIGNSGYKDGHFYARAGKTPLCRAATSKVISR